MMDRLIVVHYHELGLKKGNRDFFESRLCIHLKSALGDCGAKAIRRISGRILVDLKPDADVDEITSRLRKIPGVAYFGLAWKVPADLDVLAERAWGLIEHREFKTFCVDARRADKSFPYKSVEINQHVGGYLDDRTPANVDLEKPELTCWIEVVNRNDALLYVDRIPGPGGLPWGTGGKVIVLLSGGIDSPVAAWKMIKRGCNAIFVHFHSFPYTTKESQEKAKQLASVLAESQTRSKIYMIPFAEVQRHIMVETPADTRVILYRRYMMRLAERVARRERARVLVTGDSLGQVASQTIENIDVISRAVPMPILRPLIGSDKVEIIDLARKIGTYDISIQPDQDCCSLFVPKHPETRAQLQQVEESEAKLNVDEVMNQVFNSAEVLVQYPSWHEEASEPAATSSQTSERP